MLTVTNDWSRVDHRSGAVEDGAGRRRRRRSSTARRRWRDALQGAQQALGRVGLVVLLVVDEGRLRERLDDVLELVADDDGDLGASLPKACSMLSNCCCMIVRPSLSSVSGLGRERPRRLPMPAARITTWVVTMISSRKIWVASYAQAALFDEFACGSPLSSRLDTPLCHLQTSATPSRGTQSDAVVVSTS